MPSHYYKFDFFSRKITYPCTSVQFPANPNLVRKPRLHVVDTGLINHVKGLMGELVFSGNISDVYRGIIAEHIVGQELQASSNSVLHKIHFWTREKKESSAEVDYILPWQGGSSIEKARTTSGKEFTLLNLPFYLVHCVENELNKVLT